MIQAREVAAHNNISFVVNYRASSYNFITFQMEGVDSRFRT